MMVKKRVFWLSVLAFCLISICLASASFNVDNLLLKISSRVGQSTSQPIVISSDSGGQFSLEVIGLKGISLDATNFALLAGERKQVMVNFNSVGIEPGVYAGSIKISGPDKIYYLPVMFELESEDVFFDANLDIPSEYSEIAPGEKVVAQIKIFDLSSGGTSNGVGTQSINLEYRISDNLGNVIVSETESVVVSRENQITKTISFPKTAKEGDYFFSVIVKYKSSVGASSQLFRVKKASLSDLSGESNLRFFVILGAIVIFFLIMILFFIYIMKDRDKFIVEMKKYNAWELKKQEEFLSAQARTVSRKKGVKAGEIQREIEQKISELREKQAARVEELKKLKRKGNVKEMKARVSEWKKKGYNTLTLDYKLKGLNVKEMKQIMDKWKKKYKTEGYKKK
jgi:hypothetical protein